MRWAVVFLIASGAAHADPGQLAVRAIDGCFAEMTAYFDASLEPGVSEVDAQGMRRVVTAEVAHCGDLAESICRSADDRADCRLTLAAHLREQRFVILSTLPDEIDANSFTARRYQSELEQGRMPLDQVPCALDEAPPMEGACDYAAALMGMWAVRRAARLAAVAGAAE